MYILYITRITVITGSAWGDRHWLGFANTLTCRQKLSYYREAILKCTKVVSFWSHNYLIPNTYYSGTVNQLHLHTKKITWFPENRSDVCRSWLDKWRSCRPPPIIIWCLAMYLSTGVYATSPSIYWGRLPHPPHLFTFWGSSNRENCS